MTAKEKAKELVNKMNSQMPVKVIPIASTRENQLSCDIDLKGSFKNAVQCALIAVDEIIESRKDDNRFDDTLFQITTHYITPHPMYLTYWIKVKQEINLL